MYPYSYYPQQIQQPQSDFTLIQDKPIQNSFEQILMKLPSLISQNVIEDQKLVKTIKSNFVQLKKTKDQLSHDNSKFNTQIKKSSKALNSILNKQSSVLSLIYSLDQNLKKQINNASLNVQGWNIITQGPGIIYDDLLNTFEQIKKLLIENITFIQTDIANLISAEKIECLSLYDAINEHFNSLLYEINQLKTKETIEALNHSIINIYERINIIQSLLVSVPKIEIGNNTITTTSDMRNDNLIKLYPPKTDNLNQSTNRLHFPFKISQNRLRKKRLSEMYY